MFHKENYQDLKIAKIIWLIDAMKEEEEYTRNIVSSKVKYIDLHARNYFFIGTIVSIIKYTSKFNQHRVRNKLINEGLGLNKYP